MFLYATTANMILLSNFCIFLILKITLDKNTFRGFS